MYGNAATELIRHITRDDTEIIPEYRYDLVNKVMQETSELYEENCKTTQSAIQGRDPTDEPPTEENAAPVGGEKTGNVASDDVDEKELMLLQVRHTAKLWNRRCIIAYHFERLNRLKKLRWEYGNNLPREIARNLSDKELEWFTKYSDNLFNYMNDLNDGQGLDLTLYVSPPKRLYIKVKCIREYGQYDMEDGQPVMLKKDSMHYLPLSQCEKLIHQGVLEHLLK